MWCVCGVCMCASVCVVCDVYVCVHVFCVCGVYVCSYVVSICVVYGVYVCSYVLSVWCVHVWCVMCVCVFKFSCGTEWVGRTKESLHRSVLYFYLDVSSWDWTSIGRLGHECLTPAEPPCQCSMFVLCVSCLYVNHACAVLLDGGRGLFPWNWRSGWLWGSSCGWQELSLQ